MSTDLQQTKLVMTNRTMAILGDWGLKETGILKVLGLAGEVRSRHLERFKSEASFPDHGDIWHIVDHILHIAEALRTSYPTNPSMASVWMNSPHRRFSQKKPLEVIVERGRNGLSSVRAELDCTYAWEQSGSVR